MATRLTVFYSWQSDTPSSRNRGFIEKAILEALKRLHSDATLESALRDTTVELDKDTQGIAGSPPIADTIFRKIEECAVFVADLTFVGESKPTLLNASEKAENARQFQNPNVLIEYGYALRCHSHAKVIGIMNTAYGLPDAESLPFNLRHLRHPIQYTTDTDNDTQLKQLTDTLKKAIGLILSQHSSPVTVPEKSIPQNLIDKISEFRADRIRKILAGEMLVPLESGPKTGGFHLTPCFCIFQSWQFRSEVGGTSYAQIKNLWASRLSGDRHNLISMGFPK